MGVFLSFRQGKFFRDFPDFLHRPSGALELPQACSPFPGGSFSAPESRGARTASACSPFPGGSFSAPESRGARTALASSPLTGGEFSAEPQRGIRRLRTAGTTPYPRRWAKRKDNLRFSFLFELLPFPCFLIRRRFPICDRFENGVRQRIFSSVSFTACSQCQIAYCYTGGLVYAGATYPCCATL